MPNVLRVIFFIASLGVAPMVKAAQISASSDPQCAVKLSGAIVKGDAEALEALSDHLIDGLALDDPRDIAEAYLCFDSPGGNALEGLEIARFILENRVSTRIMAGDTCASICAIAFMMGNFSYSEVSGFDRRMHSTAKLGFHRPQLSIDDVRLYTSDDLESVFDLGMSTIFNILEVANRRLASSTGRIIEADLMQQILGTSAEEMFYVNAVEEVMRWNIKIDDVSLAYNTDGNSLYYACENVLALPLGLMSDQFGSRSLLGDEIFDLTAPYGHTVSRISERSVDLQGDRYYITSLLAGDYAAGCEFVVRENSVTYCAYDERTDLRLGDCDDPYGMERVPQFAMLHPRTEIAVLGLSDLPQGDAHRYVSCMVLEADHVPVDGETCLQSVALLVEDGQPLARHILTWPSGARTVIDVEADEYDDPDPEVLINGSLGRRVDRIEKSDCILNTNSGNTLCLTP